VIRNRTATGFVIIITELLQRLSPDPSRPDLSARGRQGTWLGLPAGALWRERRL
jgi:hypothetical protein